MDDADLIDLIAQGIVDGTDMDCTVQDQARAVLKAMREYAFTDVISILDDVASASIDVSHSALIFGCPEAKEMQSRARGLRDMLEGIQ